MMFLRTESSVGGYAAAGLGVLDCRPCMITIQSLISKNAMASITIRNPDDELKARLRVRAARRKRAMEEEACHNTP